MKRNPEKILNSLTQHSSDLAYKFERLYRLLFNEEMYYIAYQRIYTKQGNMTKGVDGKTIDGFCISHIERLIGTLKDETYQPNPSQRVYIPKKNGKMRPLGIQEPSIVVDFEEGDEVVVTGGAWKDTVGIIQSLNIQKQVATINVELFGRETPVEISFLEIKKSN